jgi:nucleoside-diphosphate-sugar epimerase
MSKPKVLVLGGVGFIGRNFVKYLVDKDLCSEIRVLDKLPTSLAFFNEAHKKAFSDSKVTTKQANLCSPQSIEKCFATEGEPWDYVFNLAAETKYGQTEEVYKEKVLDVLKKCTDEAQKIKVKKWIEVSTAQVYDAGSKPSKEGDKIKPWTNLATYKYQAEEYLKTTKLNFVILRPAIVYGPGDTYGLAPRVIVGAVYKFLDEKLKNLWTSDLQMNTVNVLDVSKAMWLSATKIKPGSIYNLADKNTTDQGKINVILEDLFKIRTGFYGKMLSSGAKAVGLKTIAETANEKHLKPWSELCKKSGITSTPLSPYVDPELIKNNALSIDGSAIESEGFTYDHPILKKEHFEDIMNYFVEQHLFPKF